jgi:hypothetical protein
MGYPALENNYELYDMINDPDEIHDLYSDELHVASELQNELIHKIETVNQPYPG